MALDYSSVHSLNHSKLADALWQIFKHIENLPGAVHAITPLTRDQRDRTKRLKPFDCSLGRRERDFQPDSRRSMRLILPMASSA